LDRAYEKSPAIPVRTAHVEIPVEPDLFDKAYVMLRSIVPSWLMAVFIVVGAVTMGLVCFRKQIKNLLSLWSEFLKWKEK
jgi:hypothetical protein